MTNAVCIGIEVSLRLTRQSERAEWQRDCSALHGRLAGNDEQLEQILLEKGRVHAEFQRQRAPEARANLAD